jgi:DNA-binding GntR family transcriptional regulator
MTVSAGRGTLPELAPIEGSDSLAARVESRLREAILDGSLTAGSHLSVPELARRLGVSRTPVRDAIYALERAGLAELRPRLGAVVFGGDREDLVHLFEVREALEGMATRQAAVRMTAETRSELATVIERHAQAVAVGAIDRHVELDEQFHRLVNASAHNPRLRTDLGRLHDQIIVLVRSIAGEPGAMGPGVLHDHRAILDAILQADPDEAEATARRHVRAVLQFLEDSLFEAEVIAGS